MNEDVEKALEVMDARWGGYGNAKAIIRQALRDQEAEIAEWSSRALREQTAHHDATQRADKAESLLLEAVDEMRYLRPMGKTIGLINRITAHLGATHD